MYSWKKRKTQNTHTTRKSMHGIVTGNKKYISCKKEVEKKNSCTVNCSVWLANCNRLNGNLAAILYYSLISWSRWNAHRRHSSLSSLELRKRIFSLSRLIHFVRSNFIMDTGSQTVLQKNSKWITMA